MKLPADRFLALLLKALGDTLWMVAATVVIAGILGLVIGILLFTTRRGGILQNRILHGVLNIVVNIVRPIPFIILVFALAPVTRAVVGTTLGSQGAIFVMCFAATFGISRIVEQNLVATDPGVIEAAKAMGAGPVRIIWSVLVPEALGPLILGYTFVIVAIVDMSAMVGAVGGGGLGDFAIQYGYQRYDWTVTFVTLVVIVVVVQLTQLLGNYLSRRALRR